MLGEKYEKLFKISGSSLKEIHKCKQFLEWKKWRIEDEANSLMTIQNQK